MANKIKDLRPRSRNTGNQEIDVTGVIASKTMRGRLGDYERGWASLVISRTKRGWPHWQACSSSSEIWGFL